MFDRSDVRKQESVRTEGDVTNTSSLRHGILRRDTVPCVCLTPENSRLQDFIFLRDHLHRHHIRMLSVVLGIPKPSLTCCIMDSLVLYRIDLTHLNASSNSSPIEKHFVLFSLCSPPVYLSIASCQPYRGINLLSLPSQRHTKPGTQITF